MTALARGLLVGVFVLIQAGGAFAQEAKSPALAKQLAAALDAAKLDSIAAADPSQPGMYVAALYFSGSELLVVSAKYSAPQLLDAKLGNKAYRDVYIDLNSASDPATKAFIEDMGANGLQGRSGTATIRSTRTRWRGSAWRSTATGRSRRCPSRTT